MKRINKYLLDEINKKNIKEVPSIIIEISGTPNSGKTTSIKKLEDLFERKKMNYAIIYEAAEKCKIENKLAAEFNYWTGSSTINQLWEVLDKKPDVVICERGIFDALCWLEFHRMRNNLDEETRDVIAAYYLNGSIKKYKQYVIELICSAQSAVDREYTMNDYLPKGTIVNEDIVNQINKSIESTKLRYEKHFEKIDIINTSQMSTGETVDKVFNCVFQYIYDKRCEFDVTK